jgi:hypothetical protein
MKSIADTISSSILMGMTRQGSTEGLTSVDSEEHDDIDLGQVLVRFRSQNGCSESDVAECLGISMNYVRLIEWGLVRNVSPKLRQRILDLVRDD